MTTTTQTTERLFLSADEIGQLMGWKRSRVYQAASAGLIPSVRVGRRYLFPKRGLEVLEQAAIERALQAQQHAATG